jgi:hypothetical protein
MITYIIYLIIKSIREVRKENQQIENEIKAYLER